MKDIFKEYQNLEEFKLTDEMKQKILDNPEIIWIAIERMAVLRCMTKDENLGKEQIKDLESIMEILNFVKYNNDEPANLGWFSQYN